MEVTEAVEDFLVRLAQKVNKLIGVLWVLREIELEEEIGVNMAIRILQELWVNKVNMVIRE